MRGRGGYEEGRRREDEEWRDTTTCTVLMGNM